MSKQRIIEAIGRCNPDEPLPPGDPRWYDFDAVRNMELHRRISRRFLGAEAGKRFSHITLAGHRGCGKSTELCRVMQVVGQEGYLPLYAVMNEEGDPNEVSFGDMVLLMLRKLEQVFNDPKLGLSPLPQRTVDEVMRWFKEMVRIDEQEIVRSLEYAGKAGLGVDTPFAKLLFHLNAMRQSNTKSREEVRQAVEKYPDQLLQNLNLLLDDAYKIAENTYPRGFVFILDNLDRYDPDMVSRAVIRQAELFKGIQAHTVFVVPISLLYEPVGDTVEDRYEPETLPMLPIFQRDTPQVPNSNVIDELSKAIYLRVERDLFENANLVGEIARLSGGCPRDMIRLLKESLLESETVITARAVQRAASIVRDEWARKLNHDHYRALARVYIDGRVNADEVGRFLLYRRAALEYNGERWHGVHPLLWETREFRQALEAERKERGAIISV